ncbi:LytTR family DNA-binding domain-containing protein [Povalibacter sp.]|uniref:LytTR family DNA-binding domain-containing protein n=1 Tax=Povalibacter sp. TaxID=1962978 RepID=UPI002F4130E8
MTQLQVSERAAVVISAPVLLAVALGWFRAGAMTRELSLLVAIVFWLCLWLIYWIAAGGFTLALQRLVPPLKRRPWLLLLLGGLCASAASAFYLEPYFGLFDSWQSAERRLRIAEVGSQPLTTRVPLAILNSLFGVSLWVVVNLFALRFGRSESPRQPAATMPMSSSSGLPSTACGEPAGHAQVMTSRLANLLGDQVTLQDIIALQAQDHYVMTYLPQGKRLILYRFRDAVAELASLDGAQVHRSWWISGSAARAARRESGSMSFRVSEDLVIPVGRTWREHAQRLRTRVVSH